MSAVPRIGRWERAEFTHFWFDLHMTVTEISRQYGVSDATVYATAKRFGLPPRMPMLEAARLGPWQRKARAA